MPEIELAQPTASVTGRSPGSESPSRSPEEAGTGSPTPAELGRLVGRALEFQGYLLRRAWGVYYLVWAAVLAGFFVVPGVFAGPISSATTAETVVYGILQVVAIGAAIGVTWWAVTHSARAVRLRNTLEGRALSRRWFLQILAVGLGITVLVIVAGYVSSFAALLLLDVSLGGVVLWLQLQVRPWFHPPPPESTVAIGSMAVSLGSSALALVLTHGPLVFSLAWLLAAFAWAFAGAYALYHAPEEMTRGGD